MNAVLYALPPHIRQEYVPDRCLKLMQHNDPHLADKLRIQIKSDFKYELSHIYTFYIHQTRQQLSFVSKTNTCMLLAHAEYQWNQTYVCFPSIMFVNEYFYYLKSWKFKKHQKANEYYQAPPTILDRRIYLEYLTSQIWITFLPTKYIHTIKNWLNN